jgi:hypothetical protein
MIPLKGGFQGGFKNSIINVELCARKPTGGRMKVVSKVVSKILYILREGSQGNRRFPAKVVY